MMRKRWIHIGSIAAALSGFSWLAKMAVITATHGEVNDKGAAAVFSVVGVAPMAIGPTAIGVPRTNHRSRLVLIVAVAPLQIVFIASFAILDSIAKPLVGDHGPAFFGDEAGVLTTALAWLMLGIALLKTLHWTRASPPLVRVREASGSGKMMTPAAYSVLDIRSARRCKAAWMARTHNQGFAWHGFSGQYVS